MALNVGELQATLGLKDKNFSSGINQATQNIQNFSNKASDSMYQAENATQNLEDAADDLSEQIDDTKSSSQDLSDVISRMDTIIEKMGNTTKEAGDNVEDAGDKIERTGNQAEKSSGFLDTLKGVLGAFGVTIGIEKVIEAVKKIGEMALESANEFDDSLKQMVASTASYGDTALYTGWTDTILGKNMGFSRDEISSAMVRLGQQYPQLKNNKEEMIALTEQYLKFSDALGMDTVDAIDKAALVFQKWGTATDEQAGYLQMFYATVGQNNIQIDDLLNVLGKSDRELQLLGKDLDSATTYVTAFAKIAGGSTADVESFLSSVSGLSVALKESLGSDSQAKDVISNFANMISKTGDETEALNVLSQALPDAGNRVNELSKACTVTDALLIQTKIDTDNASASFMDLGLTSEQQAQNAANAWDSFSQSFGQSLQGSEMAMTNFMNTLTDSGFDLKTLVDIATWTPKAMANPLWGVGEVMNGVGTAVNNIQVTLNAPDADQYTAYVNNEKAKVNMVKK